MADEMPLQAATVLETARLTLRPFHVSDAVVQHELWTERDPRVPPHRRIDAAGHPTVEDLAARISAKDPSSSGLMAIEVKSPRVVIGYCGLIDSHRQDREPELAYELLRRFWGRGYATEASCAVLDHARATGYRRIWSTVREWNTASRRVLEKLGFIETDRREASELYGDSLETMTWL